MKTKKNIRPTNTKSEYHGYQEWYRPKGTIILRTMAKHSKCIGYSEHHDGVVAEFYIK